MIYNGLTLMVIGMLAVFAFLAVIVFIMRFMSGFLLKHFPEKEMDQAQSAGGGLDIQTEVAVAIAAAYSQ